MNADDTTPSPPTNPAPQQTDTPPSPLSPSLSAPGLLVAFELDAHSPYTVDSSDQILFDIAPEHITDDTHPIPFATIPLPSTTFTLDQLRTMLRSSLQPATLVNMSSFGILTPHQVIALQSSRYRFVVDNHIVHEDEEATTAIPPSLPVLLLRVPDNLTDHVSSPHDGSLAGTPAMAPGSGSASLGSSPAGRGSSMNALQLPPSMMASGDGIHASSMDHAHPMTSTTSGISYSRASTLPMPHTRRASFDMSTHLDTLSLLEGGDRSQQQPPQQHTTSISEYHRHGLRPPRHNDRYVNEHSVRGSRAGSVSGRGPADPADDHARRTPTATPSIRRATTTPQPSVDSVNSDAEEEISPVDFPQSSTMRRRSSVPGIAGAAFPLSPPTLDSPPDPSSNENTLSSSLPSTLNGLLGFLSRSTSTSPQAPERTLPRRQSLSAERRAYYNSMDTAPSLANRRMSETAAHQLTLTLKRGDVQRELNRARTMATPTITARRTLVADIDEQRTEEAKEKADELPETKSGVSARAISAIKRKLGVKRTGSTLKRQDTKGKIHFADMMNEYSKSTAHLNSEPSEDQHYRIVVIGERGATDEREERKEEGGTAAAGENETSRQARHRKNIVSDTTQLSTRVQPIHYLNAPAASAPSRFRVYEDVNTFLHTREDEKRVTQKSRVSTHNRNSTAGDEGSMKNKIRDDVEPLWIAVEDAPASVIQQVGHHFGLHPLTD